MAVFLGLLVALSYGAGDFLGGLATRRCRPLVVVQRSQLVGLTLLAVLVLALPGQHVAGADLARGAGAGVFGVVGVFLLYRGLAEGAMSIVAPVTAVGAAVLPAAWGVAGGERPGAAALVGVALAVTAVAFVSSPQLEEGPLPHRTREVGLALVAGAGFGSVFVLLGETTSASGMWPVFAARVASVAVTSVVLLARREVPRLPAGTGPAVAVAGVLDVGANALFVLATREGLLALAAVVSSLYPAVTVVLAAVVLGEAVDRRQRVGLAMALAGVVLIAR